jgi:hypothetical protein
MTLEVLNGPVIAAGESLSDPLDCTGGNLVRITMPVDWTAAVLSFQASSDGVFFNDLFFSDGREIVFEVIPGTAVLVPVDTSAALAFIKFRSGTRENPIAQLAQRDFAVAIDRLI